MTPSLCLRFGAAGLTALLLAACSGNQQPPPACPDVKVLQDAATITKFGDGEGRDLIDVDYEGAIVDATGSCDYDVDDDTGEGNLAAEMRVLMQIGRGPANRDRKADIGYFIAITDKDRNILNREAFHGTVEFIGNRNRLNWTDEPVYLNIPLTKGKVGEDFLIFVGFTLSPEQVQYNRDHRVENAQ
jgi:hypothetical protein